MTYEAKIIEAGNLGFPDVGDYVSDGTQLFRVVSTGSTIHADENDKGIGNHVFGVVTEADWKDCPEDNQHSARVELIGPTDN